MKLIKGAAKTTIHIHTEREEEGFLFTLDILE